MMVGMTWRIRSAQPADAASFQEIEASTHEQFRAIGLDLVADEPPDPLEVLVDYAEAGRSWVACDAEGAAVGYLLVDEVDHAAHIAQVTVRPAWQGHGVGRGLIEQAISWGKARRLTSVTLTTFSDVPWNRPLYEHLGFRVLDDEEIGHRLREIQRDEARKGYGPQGRVAMRLDVDG